VVQQRMRQRARLSNDRSKIQPLWPGSNAWHGRASAEIALNPVSTQI
jgi:hypothetical protein